MCFLGKIFMKTCTILFPLAIDFGQAAIRLFLFFIVQNMCRDPVECDVIHGIFTHSFEILSTSTYSSLSTNAKKDRMLNNCEVLTKVLKILFADYSEAKWKVIFYFYIKVQIYHSPLMHRYGIQNLHFFDFNEKSTINGKIISILSSTHLQSNILIIVHKSPNWYLDTYGGIRNAESCTFFSIEISKSLGNQITIVCIQFLS